MNRKRILLVMLLGFSILTLALERDALAGKALNTKASGGAVTAFFSFDSAQPAYEYFYNGSGSLGAITGEEIFETVQDGNTCTVLNGSPGMGIEFSIAGEINVIRASSGDLLFTTAQAGGKVCVDFSNLEPPFPYSSTSTNTILGGTGKFNNAQGNFTSTTTGVILSQPSGTPGFPGAGNGSFAALQTVNKGSITTH